jgi:AcrR family transcriptional regulator
MTDIRQNILETTADLIAEEGVRGTSIREVARRAGVSHQTPYHHFGSLDGIVEALVREGFATLTEMMEEAADAAGDDPLDRLNAIGVAYVRFAVSHVGHFRVMFERSLLDVQESGVEEAEDSFGCLTMVVEGVSRAGYGASLEPEILAHLCWATVHGLAVLRIEGRLETKMSDEMPDIDAYSEQVVGALSTLVDVDR